jgi:hypothetical protein
MIERLGNWQMPDIRTSQPRPGLDTHKTLNPTDARQAVPTGRVRYILAVSLALCLVAFAIFYFVYMT